MILPGLKIIYEDRNILLINKPAGLAVHPNKPGQNKTLANRLLAHCPLIKKVGEDPLRPGIVHRLDKDTSGLMVIAKTNSAFKHLKNQFQQRKVEKKYLVLVTGQIKDDKGTITKSISQSKKAHNKRSVLWDEKAKRALTEYKVIKRFKNYTFLEAIPKTGRTHQIRIHLASIGHPLAGDKQYKFKRQPCPKGLSRHFLHAYYLKFQLPGGRMKSFKIGLAPDLEKVLQDLKHE